MLETAAERDAVQRPLDRSHRRAGPHLRSIIRAGERIPPAAERIPAVDGMRVLVVTTVGSAGRPRSSAVDGHVPHRCWVFTTRAEAVKGRDLAVRPAVSCADVDGERLAVFAHGEAEPLAPSHPDRAAVEDHLSRHDRSTPATWAPAMAYLRIVPRRMVAHAPEAAVLPAG